MAAKPRTPATREGANGSLVARLKAEVRTLCLVWGGPGENTPECRVHTGTQDCQTCFPEQSHPRMLPPPSQKNVS